MSPGYFRDFPTPFPPPFMTLVLFWLVSTTGNNDWSQLSLNFMAFCDKQLHCHLLLHCLPQDHPSMEILQEKYPKTFLACWLTSDSDVQEFLSTWVFLELSWSYANICVTRNYYGCCFFFSKIINFLSSNSNTNSYFWTFFPLMMEWRIHPISINILRL